MLLWRLEFALSFKVSDPWSHAFAGKLACFNIRVVFLFLFESLPQVSSSDSIHQQTFFSESKDCKSKPPIQVAQFGLFANEDQIIRCKGQIMNASLLTSSKSPIILLAKHTFENLLVKQTHSFVKHSGINTTLTTLREQLWVLYGRETEKR